MSAIQPMDVATPNRTMQVSASTGSGASEPGRPFAEAMRSAVSPTQTRQAASNPSSVSASSRAHSNRSTISSRMRSNRAEEPVSTSSSEGPNGNPSIRTANYDGQNVDPSLDIASSSSAVQNGGPSLVEGQDPSTAPIADVGDRSSEVTQQWVRTTATQSGSSAATADRKQTPPAKDSNGRSGTSASSAIATSTSILASYVPIILTNAPRAKLSGAEAARSSGATDTTRGLQPIGSHTTSNDSPVSTAATTPGLPTGTPQENTAGIVPNEVGISSGGITSAQILAQAHRAQTNDAGQGAASNSAGAANATATSATNQNGGSSGDTGGTQPAGVADGSTANALNNGSANSAADGNPSGTVGASATGNPSAVGNDGPAAIGGDGTSTSIHHSDGLRSSSFTAAIPSPAAKESAGPHENAADPGLGLHDSSSVFSAVSYSGTGGNFSPSNTGVTAALATTSDAFTALDSAGAGERGVLLHAAPHQVAVGVSDPSLGWVEVRAERISGQITAALSTNSSASHAALTSVLPTMATYLQEHHAGVQQVHVETSLAWGQPGAGSQGQSPSQSDARTSPDNLAMPNSGNNSWNPTPVGRGTILASQATNLINEGHHFSIRA